MAYTRQPNSVLAGRALKQNPPPTPLSPAGILPVKFDVDIATTTSLGVVQVGSGINVNANGVISVNNSGSGLINVKLTAVNYNALQTDYYIGCTNEKDDKVTITLPLGVIGKVYIIKNQDNGGSVKVTGSAGQKIDNFTTLNLSNESGIMLVFDGTRWNVI